MKAGVLASVLCIAVLAVGCSSEAVDGSAVSENVTGTTTSVTGSPSAESSKVNAQPTVNPDEYYLGYGKHAFRLDSGKAGCWFNPNTQSTEHMSCTIPLPATDAPITDPTTGILAAANSVTIDSDHARKAINVAGGLLAGPVLPTGATLTVGELECTALSATSMSCKGGGGSFTFDGDQRTVTVVDNNPITTTVASSSSPAASSFPRLVGVGEECGTISSKSVGSLPVAVLVGQVDCAEALAVADKYVNDPAVVKQGQGHFADVDGWSCSWPYVDGRSHADSYLKCSDDPIVSSNSFRIGD